MKTIFRMLVVLLCDIINVMEKIKEIIKKYWKKALGTCVIIFVGYMALTFIVPYAIWGLINYADRHQFDSSSSGENLQPLSTRGLLVPVTDVPVVLPPDPGEAGKATLAGIDSDNDGVRDDLEREIVYMYPQNQEVRRVLTAMVKKEQDMITTTGDHEHFKELNLSYLAFDNCYEYLIFGDRLAGFNSKNTDILNSMLFNTLERKKMMEVNDSKALPFAFEVSNPGSCTNPLVQGQY